MNAHLLGAIERIGRRVMTVIGRGRKTTGNDAGNVQMLQVRLGADEVRDNTPRLAEFGFASMPPDGADLIVLFVGGDRSNGVIIASGDITTRMKNLAPGESALYDSLGKHVYLKIDQIEIDAKNQPVNIINATTVTINGSGNVTVNCGGNLLANVTGVATIKAASIILKNAGTALQNLLNATLLTWLQGHVHSNGNGGANTGTPTTTPAPSTQTSVVQAE
jgi:phage baseplate assembly protein V